MHMWKEVTANILSWPQRAGPLAQSAERRADNVKVVSSSLTWTTELFFPLYTIHNNIKSIEDITIS